MHLACWIGEPGGKVGRFRNIEFDCGYFRIAAFVAVDAARQDIALVSDADSRPRTDCPLDDRLPLAYDRLWPGSKE